MSFVLPVQCIDVDELHQGHVQTNQVKLPSSFMLCVIEMVAEVERFLHKLAQLRQRGCFKVASQDKLVVGLVGEIEHPRIEESCPLLCLLHCLLLHQCDLIAYQLQMAVRFGLDKLPESLWINAELVLDIV